MNAPRSLGFLGLSGSLRAQSTNTRLLESAGDHVAAHVVYAVFRGIEALPNFNPDQADDLPRPARQLADAVRQADVLILATPEYAHGIPGAFKNALDWLVGTDAFVNKPFALYRACPRSVVAPAALLEVLRTMSGNHVTRADVTLNFGRDFNRCDAVLAEPSSIKALRDSMQYLADFVRARPEPG